MKAIEYVKSSYHEFKNHVTWPTWPTIQRDTIIVAVATVILAVFLFAVDNVFKGAISGIYNLLK